MQIKPSTPLIFVAEDDLSILELVITRLTQAGYRTRYAVNGLEAWQGIRESEPDGVLLDINMGGMDGLAVLSAIRSHPPTRKTPVLMMTARGGPEDVGEAIRLGAQDYLAKPFDVRILVQRVARLVGRRAVAGAPG